MPPFPTRRPTPTVRRPSPARRLRLDPMECRLTPATAGFTVPTDPVPEGSPVVLTAPTNDATATYQWKAFAGTDTNATPLTTGTAADFSFTPPDNGTFTVTLAVTDAAGTVSDTETVTAFNVPPTASITTTSGSLDTVPGLPVTFTLGATDPSSADTLAGFTFNVNWDGDPQTDLQILPGQPTTFTHTFTDLGTATVTVTATDKDNGTSAPATLTLQVKTAALVGDLLAVGGTDGADNFNLIPGGAGKIKVLSGGKSVGTFAGASRIAVFGLGGNDNIHLAGSIRAAADAGRRRRQRPAQGGEGE